MGKVWERPGRGHGSELFVFLVFPWFFAVWPKTSRTQKEKFRPMGKVWAIHTQTKKPKKQKTKKTKNQKTKKPKKQKTKKNKIAHPKGRGSDAECWVLSFWFFCFFLFFGFLVCVWIAIADVPSRNCQALSVVALEVGQAKTKKPKNQETKTPKNQKNQDCTPQGEGVRCRVLGLVFLFFCFFLVFWFFGFLVWIAIADVPSRDCQALSVVALEARSIHYSTAMFAMT